MMYSVYTSYNNEGEIDTLTHLNAGNGSTENLSIHEAKATERNHYSKNHVKDGVKAVHHRPVGGQHVCCVEGKPILTVGQVLEGRHAAVVISQSRYCALLCSICHVCQLSHGRCVGGGSAQQAEVEGGES